MWQTCRVTNLSSLPQPNSAFLQAEPRLQLQTLLYVGAACCSQPIVVFVSFASSFSARMRYMNVILHCLQILRAYWRWSSLILLSKSLTDRRSRHCGEVSSFQTFPSSLFEAGHRYCHGGNRSHCSVLALLAATMLGKCCVAHSTQVLHKACKRSLPKWLVPNSHFRTLGDHAGSFQ